MLCVVVVLSCSFEAFMGVPEGTFYIPPVADINPKAGLLRAEVGVWMRSTGG